MARLYLVTVESGCDNQSSLDIVLEQLKVVLKRLQHRRSKVSVFS